MTTAGSSARNTRTGASPVGVRFTERMTGRVGMGESDPWRGYERGRRERTPLTFRLTISTDDVDRFVDDPAHSAVATGWIDCDALGGRLRVQHGEFNLFVADSAHTRRMLYRLWFEDVAGHQLTLRAHKVVTDEPGADAWADTTTLLTQIVIGHVDAVDDPHAEVTAAGVLRIRPLDFARQLTTFRANGRSPRARVSGLATFGGFFLGQLWRVYGRGLTARVSGRR